jgi:1,4-dihydroxy-2-naphthoyl-CoA synthase
MNDTIEDVQRRLEDGVLWITLNRPDAGNAMTVAMRNQLIEWLEHASLDYSVRAVVLTGNGRRGSAPAPTCARHVHHRSGRRARPTWSSATAGARSSAASSA